MIEETMPLRLFRCAESDEYAKHVQALSDITFCLSCLSKALDHIHSGEGDGLLTEALVSAAVVRFFSVFDGSNAVSREDLLSEMPPGADEAYIYFRNYRSKHITHKVNPVDQIKVGAFVERSESGQLVVQGVGYLAMADASHRGNEFVQSFGNLVNATRIVLEKKIGTWQQKTLEAAQAIGAEQLVTQPVLRVVVPSGSHLLHRRG